MSTRQKAKTLITAAAMLMLSFAGKSAMGQPGTSTPSIIFVGTVEALQAVTLANITATPNTSVVAVERVVKKPDALSLDAGDKVTVVAEGGPPLQEGVQALFYTDGWMFGETMAVRLLRWEPVSANALAADDHTRIAAQAVATSADRELQRTLESTDLAVVGRVKRVQAPTVAALTAPEQKRVTEHDPEWREAIVEVESVLKGSADVREVVVRFPASVDVMWAASPKFTEGQEGTFLLQQDRLTGAPSATLNGRVVTTYTAISPKQVLGSADAATVNRVLGR